MQKIHFLPRDVTEQINPGPNCAVISIATPCDSKGQAVLDPAWESVLHLSFFDSYEENGLPAHWYFSEDTAFKIFDFVSEIAETTDELVVHCDKGISRSASVALFLGTMFGVPVFRHGLPVNPGYDQYNKVVFQRLSLSRLVYDQRQPQEVQDSGD